MPGYEKHVSLCWRGHHHCLSFFFEFNWSKTGCLDFLCNNLELNIKPIEQNKPAYIFFIKIYNYRH